MAAPKRNKNAIGNRGGGRLKHSDLNKLWDLWDGNINLKSIKSTYNKSTGLRTFKSAYDAFCYKVLHGDTTMLRMLLDKLYADQKYIETSDFSNLNYRKDLKHLSNEELYKLKQKLASELME